MASNASETVLTKAKQLLTAHADWLALATALLIAVLSFLPRSTAAGVPVNDLVNHVIAYCALTGLASVRRRTLRGVGLVVILVIGFGGLIELVQPYFGRANDLSDFIANSVGTLVGASIATIVRRMVFQET